MNMGRFALYRVSCTKCKYSSVIADVRQAWIDSFERGEDEIAQPTDRLLAHPSQAHAAQHHFDATKLERRVSKDGWVDDDDKSSPGVAEKAPERTLFGKAKEPVRGRRWDHVRDREPVISRAAASQPVSPWRTFVKSSAYGPAINEDGTTVDANFLDQQTPGYSRPWRGDVEGDDPEKAPGMFHSKKRRRRLWYERFQVRSSMGGLADIY